MRAFVASVAVVCTFVAAPAIAQESVTLSRYGESLFVANPATATVPLDLTHFHERCKDGDGCEISLLLDTGSGVTFLVSAQHGRIYLFLFDDIWLDIDNVQRTDGDSVPSVAASTTAGVSEGTSSCLLTDADPDPASDEDRGFMLILNGGQSGASCTLTVMD